MVLKMLMIMKTFKFELSAIHLVLTLETWELQYWGDHKFCIHGFRERPRPGNTYQESNCVKDLRLWEVIEWSIESEVKNCSKNSKILEMSNLRDIWIGVCIWGCKTTTKGRLCWRQQNCRIWTTYALWNWSSRHWICSCSIWCFPLWV